LEKLKLRAVAEKYGELKCEGGICFTDVEEFAEIPIDVCGVGHDVMNEFLSGDNA
jgi:hypothetical protein